MDEDRSGCGIAIKYFFLRFGVGLLSAVLAIAFIYGILYFFIGSHDEDAMRHGEKKWEYYEQAPRDQNELIHKIGPKVKTFGKAFSDENGAKMDRALWQINELCKQYQINNWIAVVDEISRSGKIYCTSCNIKFELTTSSNIATI